MKGVWTVSSIICLIILTVFILNSQFLQDAFAIPNSIPSDLSLNPNDLRSNESKLSPNSLPSDLSSNESYIGGGIFWHNAQDIATELSSLTPVEIRTYPIDDLSNNDIILVLGFLSPSNLTKVLLNIPAGDLVEIFNNLPQDKSQEVLNRLPQDKSQEVLNRILAALQ